MVRAQDTAQPEKSAAKPPASVKTSPKQDLQNEQQDLQKAIDAAGNDRAALVRNLEAFLKLDLPGSKLVYGVGPLLSQLQRAYPRVHWRGVVPRAELPRIYSAADVFVFPSRSETFGLVMLEAMACGTPVVAGPAWGSREAISAPEAGVVLDKVSPESIAQALRQMLANPPSRRATRAHAERFGWGETTRGQAELFSNLLAMRGDAA